MDELNLKTLEQIPIPDGLDELTWDLIAGLPEDVAAGLVSILPKVLRYTAAAASVVLVVGVGIHLLNQDRNVNMNLVQQDTYQDPVRARQEADRALNLLAYNLNKGMGQLEKAKALSDKTKQSFNEKLKVLK